MTIKRAWIAVFALWSLFLSGVGAGFVGSPGVIQQLRLQSLLDSKHALLGQMRVELRLLQNEAGQLEHNRVAQQREIRRLLGYTAPDEIIFDFTRDFTRDFPR